VWHGYNVCLVRRDFISELSRSNQANLFDISLDLIPDLGGPSHLTGQLDRSSIGAIRSPSSAVVCDKGVIVIATGEKIMEIFGRKARTGGKQAGKEH